MICWALGSPAEKTKLFVCYEFGCNHMRHWSTFALLKLLLLLLMLLLHSPDVTCNMVHSCIAGVDVAVLVVARPRCDMRHGPLLHCWS